MRAHVIFTKTLRDLSNIKRNLFYLGVLLLVPLIAALATSHSNPFGMPFAELTLAMQTQFAVGMMIIINFLWTAGIPLVLLAALSCASFIAKEDEDGTLLLLVSKPVRRFEILGGKFAAFLVNAALLEAIGLLLTTLIIYIGLGTDVYVLENLLSLVPWLWLYSLFVMLLFGALSLSVSSLLRSRMRTIILVVVLAIFIFFGIGLFRGMLGRFYEPYILYSVDVNYHLGNSYLLFTEATGFRVMPIFQGVIGQFTGTYDAASLQMIFDQDIGAMPPTLPPKDYFSQGFSLALWLAVGVGLLILAVFDFERREVQR